MRLSDYQLQARSTACYPTDGDTPFAYLALGLAGEAGEVANKVKKVIRRRGKFDEAEKTAIAEELGDVLWYLAGLAWEFGLDLDSIASNNLSKLQSRKERGTIEGNGDNR